MTTRFFSRFVSRRVAADRSFFKKKTAPGHRRRLQLESLETRAMLATFASGEWGWAGTLGAGTSINSMCTDSSGAVVVSGTLSGSCDVDPGEGISTLVSAGGTDAFVAKYTSAGALLWARSFGGTGNEQGICVTIDSRDDSLLVGGAFSGVVDFDPGPRDSLRTSAGYYDAYMSKFGSDGSFQWVGTLGSNRAPTFGNAEAIEYVNGMDVDADGNIFATGMFNGNATARFGAGSADLASGGPQNTFILEVQPSGNLVWAKQFHSTFLNGGTEIKVLPSGGLAVRGGFHTYSGGPPDFDPGAGTAYGKAYGYADAYLALLERNGDYVWSSSFGTSSEDGAAGLAVDADGFLYLVGSFGGRWGGTIDLDPGAAAASFTAEGTNEDIFVVKLSPTGGYVWGRRIGGTATEQGRTAKISPEGKLVIAGVFSGTVDFDPGPGQQYQTSAGGIDGFLLTLNSADGSLSGVERFGGVGDDLPAAAALAFGPAGQAYLSGAIPGAVDFSQGAGVTSVGAATGTSGFVWKFDDLNVAPTAVALTATAVSENQPAGTFIGEFSTADADGGNTFTYVLVDGSGGTDNSSFQIVGDQLRTGASFDYEAKRTYSIRVRTMDSGGLFTEGSFTITVDDVAERISPAASTIPEGLATGSVVAPLVRKDAYSGWTPLTVIYVASSGQMLLQNTTDSAIGIQSVQIVSPSQRLTGAAPDLPRAEFSIRNTGDGIYGLASEIFFANVGTAALTLPAGAASNFGFVAEVGLTSSQLVSSFATDPDVDYLPGSSAGQFLYSLPGDDVPTRGLIAHGYREYTYALVSGIGDTDNAFFAIDGTNLKVAGAIDYEAKSRYTIRVRSTAQDGTSIEEVLTIDATDVNEAPTAASLGNVTSSLNENTSTASRTKLADIAITDDALGTNMLSLSGVDAASFEIVQTALYLKAGVTLDYESKSSYDVTVVATDATVAGSVLVSVAYTLSVTNLNETPSDIALSGNVLAENLPVGTTVGALSTTDQDAGDSFTYSLVSGTGSTDNAAFEIVGGTLTSKSVFDYEAKRSYSVRVRSTDSGSLSAEKVFTISVTDVNESPTAVGLEHVTGALTENTSTSSRTKLADIAVTDDALGTNILSLSGADAASFEIVGTALYLKAGVTLDHELRSSYAVTVSVADSGLVGPASAYTPYTLSVTNLNETPSDIALSGNAIAENLVAGTTVGTFSTTDQDVGDTFTYSFASGTGSADNAAFEIAGGELKSKAAFDYETKNSYSVRVRSTDAGGLATEKVFTILVTDVNDAPTNIALSGSSIAENLPVGTVVGTFSADDQDTVGAFAFTLASGAGDDDNSLFEIVGTSLRIASPLDYETNRLLSLRVRATDASGGSADGVVTLAVTDANEMPRSVTLIPVYDSVPENTNTANRLKVADIRIDDDALGTNTLSLSGADASSFQIDGLALYLNAGMVLNYGLKASYDITVDATDGTAVDVVSPTPLTLSYNAASGNLHLRNTTSTPLPLASVSILSPTHALNGNAATLPAAAFTTLNTSEQGLFGLYSEIFFGNIGSAVVTLPAGGAWALGAAAATGLTSFDVFSAFGTDPDSDPEGTAGRGRFLYSLFDGVGVTETIRGAIVRDIATSFVLQVANVPEFSGREYAEVAVGETVIDVASRTGGRQVIVRGGGTLVLAAANAHTGGVMVEDGTLIIRNTSALGTGTLDVGSGGIVTIDVGFGRATVGGVTVAADARIDLGTGGLQIAAGGITQSGLRGYLASARNGGLWNGYGIGSGSASTATRRAIGYRQLPSGVIQVAWAAFGDTNLDGRVNSSDIIALNTARKFGSNTPDSHWWQGDFNYDGRVNSTDIQFLTLMFGKPQYNLAPVATVADVPNGSVKSLSAQLFAAFGGVKSAEE